MLKYYYSKYFYGKMSFLGEEKRTKECANPYSIWQRRRKNRAWWFHDGRKICPVEKNATWRYIYLSLLSYILYTYQLMAVVGHIFFFSSSSMCCCCLPLPCWFLTRRQMVMVLLPNRHPLALPLPSPSNSQAQQQQRSSMNIYIIHIVPWTVFLFLLDKHVRPLRTCS